MDRCCTWVLACALAAAGAPACRKDVPQPASSPSAEPLASAAPTSSSPSTDGAAGHAVGAGDGWTVAKAPAGKRPSFADFNVILLSIDSWRADMPWAGYPRAIAPRLAEVEKRAVVFDRAYSVSSYTSMSLGGLLAGRVPSELSRDGYFFGLYRRGQFFPKELQNAGVHTMGVQAHMYFKSAGFDSGFDDWRLVPGITFDPNTDRDITSPAHEKLAEEMLADPANDGRRFFFWAHFLDPHDLYMQHDGIDWGSSPRDRYDGEVTFTDGYVGKLLDFIATKPWAPRTVIVLTADHGEEFGEHGMTRHGFEVWNTLVHVPLMVLAPGAAPHHVDVPRSGADLAPTIFEFFGLPPETTFEGKSLVGEIYGDPPAERDIVVDLPATSDNGRRRALVHDDRKIICFDTDKACKVFDLAADPMEKSPITHGSDYQDMKARYDAACTNIKDVPATACGPDCLNGAYRKKTSQP
jgi:arylsulfatase A-like enzyme